MSVAMKASGIEWIGDIPENWKIKRIKDELESLNPIRIPLSAAERGTMEKKYDYYGASGVIDQVEDYLFDGTYLLVAEDGANLLSRSTALAFLAHGQFWVNNHAHILKPYFGNIKYFTYLLESINFSLYVTGAAQPKLTQENLGRICVVVPSNYEQQAITNFLDHATAKINYVIKTKQTQLKTLETLKKSIIHKAVTKGLYTSVTMKDSGVEWIGDIPRTWEVRRIKSFADYVSRGNSPTYDDDGSIKVVNQSCVYSDALKYEKLKVNQDEDISDFKGKLQQYDLLINSTGTGTLGRTGVFMLDAVNYIADGHVTIVRDSYGRLNPFYLNYIFYDKQDMFSEAYALGATNQIELQREKFRTLSVPYPSLNEQQAIVNFLDNEAEKINTLKANVQKQIDLLKEYKKSLIYEYVTGKKQVKE